MLTRPMHTVPFWPLFPLQVSTLSHKSENWSHQNLALPYYILPPPVLACTTNICSIVVQFFWHFVHIHISHIQQSKEMFSKDMLKKWNAPQACSSASHITIPVFRVFLILQLGASFYSPLFQMHTHTHHIWLQLYKYCLFPFFSWTLLSHFFIMASCDKLKLNSKKHGILQPNPLSHPAPFTAIFVILRLLVRVRSPNQIPAGNLVPTFLWKPPGCKSCLIDWQVWRRGQQSLGGLVVLEGKGPWWDD